MKLKVAKQWNWSFRFFVRLVVFGMMFLCVVVELLLDYEVTDLKGIFRSSSPCEGRLVYVYELPSDFNDDLVYRSCNDSKASSTLKELCQHFLNGGFGPAEIQNNVPENTWYKTFQYTLEVIFRERFKTYPCCTMDPQHANLFYIPYYPLIDLHEHLFSKTMQLRDRLSQKLTGWLLASPYFHRYHGMDHLLVVGSDFANFIRYQEGSGWGTSILTFPELHNVTKVLTERNYWSHQESEIAIPYPTGFHPSSPIDVQGWQHIVSSYKRDVLVSYSGGPRHGNGSIPLLRNLLQEQCEYSFNCTMLRCDKIDCANNPYLVTSLYLRSTFCLMPPGDTPTRKAIFDSMLSGCIPVLFSEHSAYDQYIWHLPSNGSTYSVFYSLEQLLNSNGSINMIDYLTHITADVIKTMQQNIIEIIPMIVYAKSGYKSYDSRTRDAFEIVIEKALKRASLYQK